jgi:hypothetical protein
LYPEERPQARSKTGHAELVAVADFRLGNGNFTDPF